MHLRLFSYTINDALQPDLSKVEKLRCFFKRAFNVEHVFVVPSGLAQINFGKLIMPSTNFTQNDFARVTIVSGIAAA